MDKKYDCLFIDKMDIDSESEHYKDYCAFNEEVKPDTILRKFYTKSLFRKSLKCDLKRTGEKITVILMNPSFADECGLDATITNVKDLLLASKKLDVSEFEVLNVFPIRMPKSNILPELLQKYDNKKVFQKENKTYIKEVLKKSTKVLVAWGSKYNYRKDGVDAQWIYKELENKKLYAYGAGLNKDGSPKHLTPLVYHKLKHKCDVIEVKIDNSNSSKKCFKR